MQNEKYIYKSYGNGYTTNLLSSIDDQTNKDYDRTATYDANGYVTSVRYNEKTYSYTYDNAGRLLTEQNRGVTTSYQYDSYNNVQKAGLTYTNGKLTSVNGAQIIYDEIGNPVVYKGNTFVWEQGRKLVSGTLNENNFAYNYDGNGMRYKKDVNDKETYYYYDGTQLLMESSGTTQIYYIYGATGIEGMIYNVNLFDCVYYFDKNTLGDVIAIRDESGNIVATYEYDAWGNVTVMDEYGYVNTSSSFIGNVNPIRYRGYYYDTETGFYYLQTRYYDPTICRFINADNYELVATLSSVPGQLNMYAYCNNNPIMYTDETGAFAISLTVLGFIIGAAIGATAGGIIAYNIAEEQGATGQELVGWTALGIVGGGIVGGAIGAGAGALIGLAPTIGASLGAMMSGTAGAGASVALASTYVVAAGATAALGMNLMFASSNRPGDNKKQNQQFRDAMRKLGITDKDQMRRVHDKIRGRNMGYNELLQFIKQVLNLR